jgi:hypothetical protein
LTQPPELRDVIGDEGPDDRLQRVHDMLVAAGPPPEGALPQPPEVGRQAVRARPRRRRWAELALAAAFVCIALAVGFVVGDRGDGFEPATTLSMNGVPPVADASGELAIGEPDAGGNVVIDMHVDGLPRLPRGGWYELALANNGEVGALCGTFATTGDETTVRFTVGYDLSALRKAGRYDSWVVTAVVPGRPGSDKRILLTT